MTDPESMTAQERAALALWLLLQQPHTTREISRWCGLSMSATRIMLHKIARVVPIQYDRREWRVIGRET